MKRIFAAAVLGGFMVATSASSCGFHNYAPQPTFVDRLLGSDDIVLARPKSENPFSYEAVEALEGTLDYVEIPQLVDSTTRRRFALDPSATVLFARDGAYGPWQRIAFVDTAFEPILRTVMSRLSAWELGEDIDRFAYFASILNHPDPVIHGLALRELDMASYDLLRSLQIELDVVRLSERIQDINETDLKPIRILLLGLSGDLGVEPWVEKGLHDSVQSQGQYIGAYATALVELRGAEAVEHIAASYLTDPSLPRYTRELLVEALALHGQRQDSSLGDSVSEAIESAIWVDPGLSGAVARQFGTRGVWSQADILSIALSENTVVAEDREDVVQYVRFAAEARPGN